MAHVMKATKSQVGGLTRHFERCKNEQGEYIKFGNMEINTNKTHLNYNLAENKNQLAFIKQRTSEVKCLNRSNVNVMCNWVLTLPKTIEENSVEEEKFFKAAYEFFEGKYSKENVISAYVHKDETTPHMHFAFVPVIHDKKKNTPKVSAKEILTRNHLQSFHTELDEHIQKTFGKEIGILNEATKEGNKKVAELKQSTMIEKIAKIEKNIKSLEKKENALQGKIEALEKEYTSKVLIKKELIEIKPEKGPFGMLKNITLKTIERMKKTILTLFSENFSLKRLIEKLRGENKKLQQEKAVLKKKIPSVEEQMMEFKEKHRLEQIEIAFLKLPEETQKELLIPEKRALHRERSL